MKKIFLNSLLTLSPIVGFSVVSCSQSNSDPTINFVNMINTNKEKVLCIEMKSNNYLNQYTVNDFELHNKKNEKIVISYSESKIIDKNKLILVFLDAIDTEFN